VAGVLYNVVRRPAIRPSKRKMESLREFAQRLREDVAERPDFYFHRWEVNLEPGDLPEWQCACLDPILRSLVQWWDSIKGHPFEPWKSPLHYRRPFGIYDGMASGRRGDFFEHITSGSYAGLVQIATVFPELEMEV